jgi:spore coat polysaccharide biosynthesis predicted glycosyltransferase SpsG
VSTAVAVLADGGPQAGLGHLGRCSAITAALRARGLTVSCWAYGALGGVEIDGIAWTPLASAESLPAPAGGVVVVDSYTLPEAARAALTARWSVAAMHDFGGVPAGAALVVSIGGEPAAAPLTLSGLQFAPLRAPFWGLPERVAGDRVRRVLVTAGGGPLQAAGVEFARAVRAALPDAAIALVRGPGAAFAAPPGVELVDAPPSLLAELRAADVVVSAAGQTALEAAATGAATVAVVMVDNQRRNALALADAGAAVAVEPAEAVGAAVALAGDAGRRATLVRRAQAAVDGYGALRIAFRVAELVTLDR